MSFNLSMNSGWCSHSIVCSEYILQKDSICAAHQSAPFPIEDDASLGEGVPNPIRSPRPRLCYLQLDSLDRESPKPDSSGQLRLSPANQSAGGANLGRAD
jgi:hypothetical protein